MQLNSSLWKQTNYGHFFPSLLIVSIAFLERWVCLFSISVDSPPAVRQKSSGWSQFGSQPKTKEPGMRARWDDPPSRCQQSWLSVKESGADSITISLHLNALCLRHSTLSVSECSDGRVLKHESILLCIWHRCHIEASEDASSWVYCVLAHFGHLFIIFYISLMVLILASPKHCLIFTLLTCILSV